VEWLDYRNEKGELQMKIKQKTTVAITAVMLFAALLGVRYVEASSSKEPTCSGGYSPGACIASQACEIFIYRTCQSNGEWSDCHFKCLPVDGDQ
jgi:hypothetical protein